MVDKKDFVSKGRNIMMTGGYSLISGLCLMLMLILYMRMVTGVERTERRDHYIGLILVGMLYLGLDVLWGVIYDDLLPIPVAVQRFIYAGYYASSAILSYRWFAYVELMQESVFHENIVVRRLVKIPAWGVVAVSVASLWTGWFFEIAPDGSYMRGPWYVGQLVATYGYIIFSATKVMLRMLLSKEFEKQNTYMVLLSYFMFPVVFGILQIFNQDMPYLCIGIALATLQTYLFYVNYETERERSASKIHSLTRLFISAYYLDLQTGKREFLSNEMERPEEYLTGDFYKKVPQSYEDSVQLYVDRYVHLEDKKLYRTMCDVEYMKKNLTPDNLFYFFNYRQVVNGIEKWYGMNLVAAEFGADDKVTHVVMAVMDVDKQEKLKISQNEAIKDALVQARKANEAKSTFLSSVSHDIRTPMNAIMGFTNLAQTHIDEKETVQNYLEKIRSASRHLLSLINDVLDMSRIESGKIQIEESEVSLPDVIEEIQNMIQPMAEEAHQEFIIEKDVRDNFIYTDKLRLNQVLINLLGNAIKFTPQGGKIWLTIKQEAEAPEGYGVYQFSVKDTGIGIAPEFIDKVFKAFEREQTTTLSGIQGTGLGLSITRSIIEMMGGRITVASEVNKGSEFTVKLIFLLQDVEGNRLSSEELAALRKEEARRAEEERKVLFAGKHILVVEDNYLNMEIIRTILREEGIVVEEANNGKMAIEKLLESPAGTYEMLLMDVQMPIMDGYEATKQIRGMADKGYAEVPIVAMTANAFEEEKKKALSLGMNAHISKPVEINHLFEIITKIIKANQ